MSHTSASSRNDDDDDDDDDEDDDDDGAFPPLRLLLLLAVDAARGARATPAHQHFHPGVRMTEMHSSSATGSSGADGRSCPWPRPIDSSALVVVVV